MAIAAPAETTAAHEMSPVECDAFIRRRTTEEILRDLAALDVDDEGAVVTSIGLSVMPIIRSIVRRYDAKAARRAATAAVMDGPEAES